MQSGLGLGKEKSNVHVSIDMSLAPWWIITPPGMLRLQCAVNRVNTGTVNLSKTKIQARGLGTVPGAEAENHSREIWLGGTTQTPRIHCGVGVGRPGTTAVRCNRYCCSCPPSCRQKLHVVVTLRWHVTYLVFITAS